MEYDPAEIVAKEDLLHPENRKENEGDGEMGEQYSLMMPPQ